MRMRTVIMAGGKGTRIASIARDIPKPMLPIGGKPILEHELECLRGQGFTDVILTVGHLGQIIVEYFGDGSKISPATGKSFGMKISYYFEKQPLGNAGALFHICDQLTEDFLLLNADALFDIDFQRFVSFHQKHGGLVTLFTHPNDHPYDSGLIITDEKGRVTQWLAKEDVRPAYYHNQVNAGLHVISPKLLEQQFDDLRIDLDRQLLKPLAASGQMYAYNSPEYVKDMGTPKRYEEVCRDFERGYVQRKNLRNKQRAVFLDRDGTLNRYVGFLRDPAELELLPHAAEMVRKINRSGYLAILVTNQPVIARGEVTVDRLREIHNKLETLLGEAGAYLDAIYYCPHHPDKGFSGEIPELKTECECRKPRPGMLLRAAEDWNIDLSESWMVGDSESDMLAGKAAGCRTHLLKEQKKETQGS